jgi:hypothetical protein
MKSWCEQKGQRIRLLIAPTFVIEQEELDPILAASWQKDYGTHIWPSRDAWFLKPLACLQSPFETTLWIDLDCEIRAPLHSLFAYSSNPTGLAMALDVGSLQPPMYNSGVISFKKQCKLIDQWAEASFQRNHEFIGDQDLLSTLIAEQNLTIGLLPATYNWSRYLPENHEANILHWHGPWGKAIIRQQIARSLSKNIDT